MSDEGVICPSCGGVRGSRGGGETRADAASERVEPPSSMTHDERLGIMKAMLTHGGGFVRALGAAMFRADDENLRKLEAAFPEYIAQYREVAKMKGTM